MKTKRKTLTELQRGQITASVLANPNLDSDARLALYELLASSVKIEVTYTGWEAK